MNGPTFGIRIKADASGFKGQVGEAKREVEDFGKKSDSASIALASKFGVAIGAAAVAVGGVFVNEVRKAIGALDELDETAQALGIASDKLSSMQISARAAGVESNQLTTALTRLNAQIADAGAGNARSTALFKSMGIEVRTTAGALKTADVVLGEIAERFRGYQDGAAKSNLATDLFGRGAGKMAVYLNEGAEGLTKFEGASRDQIEAAAALNGQVDKLSAAWDRLTLAVGGTVAVNITPWLTSVVSQFEQATRAGLDFWTALGTGVDRTSGLAELQEELKRTNQWIDKVGTGFLAGTNLGNDSLDRAIKKAGYLRQLIAQRTAEANAFESGFVGSDTRVEAPNSGGTPRERAGGRSSLTEAQREEIALARELQQIRSAGYQAALREEQQRARELAQLEEQNQAIRNQIEEFGKTELQVAELRAARLEEAAAQKEQRLAQLELVDGNEAEIVQMRAQIALLRERARLTRAAGRQVQDERDADAANDAATAAARAAADENARMTADLQRGLTDALMRGFEGGKDAARNFFDTVANMIQTMLLRRLAEGFINQVFNAAGLGSGGGGSAYGGQGEVFHAGGIVGQGRVTRSVAAGAWAGARRMHGGGLVAGEVPIIARAGEGAFTPEQMAAMGGAGKVTVNVINKTGAQVRTEERSDGNGLSIDVILEQVEDRLAGNVSRGRGSLGQALEGRYALRPQAR